MDLDGDNASLLNARFGFRKVNRLHPIEPQLNMIAFGSNSIVIPVQNKAIDPKLDCSQNSYKCK